MNFIRLLLTLLIAFNSASAAATAPATTKVTLATHAITASVTHATYTTVTAATFAAHAPSATPFVYPVTTDFGYEQVPSTFETIKYHLMSFWDRLSEPILEFKEKLQQRFVDFMADRQPDDKETLTLGELHDRSLAEKKLKDDAAAIEQQLKETEESRPLCPPDITGFVLPVSFLNGTLGTYDFTKHPGVNMAAYMKLMHRETDLPSAADPPAVSSNDTNDHSYIEPNPLYELLNWLALGLALCYELTRYDWVQFFMKFLWEKLVAAPERLMSRRMIERLQSVDWGRLYDLKLSLSTWALSIPDKFASTKEMICRLLNTIKAVVVHVSIEVLDIMVSKMLNRFDIDLAPLRATVQLLFNGQPNALRIITATSPSVVDKLQIYVEKRPPSAKSRSKAPFEAGPPEPRNQPTRLGLPQSHSEVTSNDDPIQHSSMPLPMPESIDEQLLTEPPVGDTAGAEQDSQLPVPMANTEKAVYRCDIDEFSETLTALATYPVFASEPKKFLARVAFIRAHQTIIRLQADGMVHVREFKRQFNQGVENLISETDFLVIEGLSGLGGTLEKLEAAYAKGLNIERLIENSKFIDDRNREGNLVRFKHGRKVKKMVNLLKANVAKRQQCTEEFLQGVRGLCEIYNENLERITGTSNARGSL